MTASTTIELSRSPRMESITIRVEAIAISFTEVRPTVRLTDLTRRRDATRRDEAHSFALGLRAPCITPSIGSSAHH